MQHYILDGHEPVPVDLLEWAKWFEANSNKRIVAEEEVGPLLVSTIFVGLDYGTDMLFETMVFDDPKLTRRYRTWAEAKAGHNAVVVSLTKAKP